jgi:hypothetical protein
LQGGNKLEAHGNHEHENEEYHEEVLHVKEDLEDDINEWSHRVKKTQEVRSFQE